ncbi:MAG: primosomal protein N' [Desulfomonile tiedjei]|uniref:Replication restart protein PriA n=1 Tax=Desulfomonile tiedjei TaxID=2358 RepID=A0A9D6V0N1_9BACT|nr:primosomal protein N' [Desulfomonile tiedjei]
MTETGQYVDISIPLPLEGPFTYRVPEKLAPFVQTGRRVLVPFRNKIRAGFIVGNTNSIPPNQEIKDVIDIPDEAPYLSPKLWSFISWAADYYMLPAGQVLKTALPPGSDRKSRPWAIITLEGERSLPTAEKLKCPAKFLKVGVLLRSELESAIGGGQLEDAIQKGWIRIEERIARPRTSLRRKRLPELLYPAAHKSESNSPLPTLTGDQRTAVERIRGAVEQGGFHPFLLFGVTGSGKTEVYLRIIHEILSRGKRALVLVPEIALTPQLARRFLRRIGGGVGIFHSGLTPSQRLDEWRRVSAGKVNVVIAARSGVFLPMDDLGLIVVDEEHDPSYKQEDSCPYNARDMALARAKLEGACVILGSATPSFETFLNAERGKITRIDLPIRHHGGGLPEVQLVDLKETVPKKKAFLTETLLDAIQRTLAGKEQVVLFLNRRGFDTYAQCRSCGYVFKCPNCDISLTHHKRARDLRCHLCGLSRAAPPLCPQCSGDKLFFGGVGTQKVEEELRELFPEARIERLDRDSTRKRNELENILDRFRKKEIDILTGTQMIVKGHDFPGIALVGVLCGDLSLHFPDFRAAERTFQMLTQVAGRTGRESDSGRVILQTFDPDHDAIRFAASHDFTGFFEHDSEMRRELFYPPFGHLILIRVEGNSEKRVESRAIKIGRAARILKKGFGDISILGPAPSPRKKAVGRFRWQVLFKSPSRANVRGLVKSLKSDGHLKGQGLKVIIDVDPIDMM